MCFFAGGFFFTISFSVPEVLATKSALPLYTTVILLPPNANFFVLIAAVPLESGVVGVVEVPTYESRPVQASAVWAVQVWALASWAFASRALASGAFEVVETGARQPRMGRALRRGIPGRRGFEVRGEDAADELISSEAASTPRQRFQVEDLIDLEVPHHALA